MKKILAIVMAVMMVMALSVTAFAADYGTASNGPAGVYFKTSSGDNTLRIGDTLTVTFDGTVAAEFCLKAMYDADGTTNYCNLAIFGGSYKDVAFDGSEATKYFGAYGVNDGDVARLGLTAVFTEVEGGASTIVFTVTEAPVEKFSFYGDVGNVGDSYGWSDFFVVNEPSTTAPASAETNAPAEEAPTEAPADTTAPTDTAPAAETTTPADTGIVLAVLPMAIAAAAVVISKRK